MALFAFRQIQINDNLTNDISDLRLTIKSLEENAKKVILLESKFQNFQTFESESKLALSNLTTAYEAHALNLSTKETELD